MSGPIDHHQLLSMARRDVSVRGREPLDAILEGGPDHIDFVTEPNHPPADVHTYRVRRDRWAAGDGPETHGIEEFVDVLENLEEPARLARVSGDLTTYVLVIAHDCTRILAATAVESREA